MMQATNLDADDLHLHLHLPHCLSVCQTTTNLALAQSGPRVLSAPQTPPVFCCHPCAASGLQDTFRYCTVFQMPSISASASVSKALTDSCRFWNPA